MRRDSNRAIATDSEGHELRVNDNVREIEGEVRTCLDKSTLELSSCSSAAKDECFTSTNHFLPSSTIVMLQRMEAYSLHAVVHWLR